MKNKPQIYFTLISLVIVDSFRWLSYGGFLNFDFSTYISLILIYISISFLMFFALNSEWRKDTNVSIRNLLKLWIGLNVIIFFRSLFLAKDYWDFKFLFFNAVTFILICLTFFIGNNIQKFAVVFKFVLKYLFPLGFLLIPLTIATNPELYSRIMIPIGLFVLFIPFVNVRYKLLIVLVALASIFMEIAFRSNIIKIAFSTLLLAIYYFNLNYKLIKTINFSLFVLPLILFLLGVLGRFSIFKEIARNSQFQIETNEKSGETFASDSRTFLYLEVLQSIIKDGNFFIGSGYTKGYHSVLIKVASGSSSPYKRYECEVGILNILRQSGLLGVLLYFLLLLRVAFLAISNSSNRLSKMLGLYISFRWLLSFIEEFTHYDLNFYFFWLAIGLVSSDSFRDMSDSEIKKFIQSIFYPKNS